MSRHTIPPTQPPTPMPTSSMSSDDPGPVFGRLLITLGTVTAPKEEHPQPLEDNVIFHIDVDPD